jgi:MurNAc alpha-1-phosphate uridylyltransferase
MKAMILAAGLGTRLRPLTNDRPKALVTINGITLLERLIIRLRDNGFHQLIVNAHHFSGLIENFIANNDFGIPVSVSTEKDLLDTGGGLKQARWFFDTNQPFLLHNVDVLTNLNYRLLFEQQKQSNSLAALAVRKRDTSRYFLFDRQMQLAGWQNRVSGEEKIARPNASAYHPYSFMGIHVISPELFRYFPQENRFSVVDLYLNLAQSGSIISAVDCSHAAWLDVGKPEQLQQAATDPDFS